MVIGNVDFNIDDILAQINSEKSALSLSFKNLIYDKYYEARSVTEFNTIKTGVTCGDKIGFISLGNSYGSMTSAESSASGCEYNDCDINITTSVKVWDTHKYNCQVQFCKSDMECAFADWFGLNCKQGDDLDDSFVNFLVSYITENIRRSHWRQVWFSDSSLAVSSNLYGSDGIWVKALAAANTNSNVISIPENANLDYASQGALDTQRGYEVFYAMYKSLRKNRNLKKKRGSLKIRATEDLVLNYLDYLRENNQVNCCFKSDVTQEVYTETNLNIFGLPIEVVYEWDDIIRGGEFADLDDGTRYDSPHRAILTYKENIPFGTCDAKMLDEVKPVYDVVNEQLYLRSKYDLGTEVILEDELIIAI